MNAQQTYLAADAAHRALLLRKAAGDDTITGAALSASAQTVKAASVPWRAEQAAQRALTQTP